MYTFQISVPNEHVEKFAFKLGLMRCYIQKTEYIKENYSWIHIAVNTQREFHYLAGFVDGMKVATKP